MFDDIHDAGELITTAIGAGSMCWENVRAAGVFDSTRAAEIAEAAKQRLQVILAGHFATAVQPNVDMAAEFFPQAKGR